MTTHEQLMAELKAKKEDCAIAGCMDELITKDECKKNHNDLKLCMTGIKNTMQTKSHYAWELAKVIVIPLLTTALIAWGLFSSLQTKVNILQESFNKLEQNVMELIKDKR